MLTSPEDVNDSWSILKRIDRGINHVGSIMKFREPRRKVLIHARMRSGTVWVDVRIRNMSSRGLLGQTEDPPAPGTYVEIRRTTHVIIGRCVWRKAREFGVRTQDRLDIDAIIEESVLAAKPCADQRAGQSCPAKRSNPELLQADKSARQLDRSRQMSSAIQFLFIVGLGMVAAGLAASAIHDILSQPVKAIEAGLQS